MSIITGNGAGVSTPTSLLAPKPKIGDLSAKGPDTSIFNVETSGSLASKGPETSGSLAFGGIETSGSMASAGGSSGGSSGGLSVTA